MLVVYSVKTNVLFVVELRVKNRRHQHNRVKRTDGSAQVRIKQAIKISEAQGNL